jgi:hypothetical protein
MLLRGRRAYLTWSNEARPGRDAVELAEALLEEGSLGSVVGERQGRFVCRAASEARSAGAAGRRGSPAR